MKTRADIEDVSVEFLVADVGWLDFTITVGEQSYSDSFTCVFDPIQDLKVWLEAITLGVQQTSFFYDNEYEKIKFDFGHIAWNINSLTISKLYNPDDILINTATIDRKQLVQAFYKALLAFADSSKYQRYHWEPEYVGDIIVEHGNLATEEDVINKLLSLDTETLSLVLGGAEDPYGITCVFDMNTYKCEKDYHWYMPLDYEQWSDDQKINYLLECLDEETNRGNDGMSLKKFQSDIIDKYLKNGVYID